MAIVMNTPSTNLLLTAQKIEAALGGEPLLIKDLDKHVVTGIKGVGEDAYKTGKYDLTAAKVGLGKVENLTSAEILAKLTKEAVELLLNAEFEDDGDGVDDRLKAIEQALGLSEGADEKTLTERIEDIESALEDKLESEDITRVLLETTLGNTGYTGATGGAEGIYDQLQKKLDSSALTKAAVEKLLGLYAGDSAAEGETLLERLNALVAKDTALETNKMDKNAFTKAAVETLLGFDFSEDDYGEAESIKDVIDSILDLVGESEDGTSLADRVGALEEDLEQLEQDIEDTYIKDTDLDGAEIARRLGFTPESSEDELVKYTFLKNKWYEQMGGTSNNEPTGYYAYDIAYADLGLEKDYEDEMDFQFAPDLTQDPNKTMASIEAGLLGGVQTATKLTILALNEPSSDFSMMVKADFKKSGTAGEDD